MGRLAWGMTGLVLLGFVAASPPAEALTCNNTACVDAAIQSSPCGPIGEGVTCYWGESDHRGTEFCCSGTGILERLTNGFAQYVCSFPIGNGCFNTDEEALEEKYDGGFFGCQKWEATTTTTLGAASETVGSAECPNFPDP